MATTPTTRGSRPAAAKPAGRSTTRPSAAVKPAASKAAAAATPKVEEPAAPQAAEAAPAPIPAEVVAPAAAAVAPKAADPVLFPAVDPVVMPHPEEALAAGKAAVEDVVKAGAQAAETGKAVVENVVKAGTEVASNTYEKAVSLSKEQVAAAEKAGDDLRKQADEALGLCRKTMEAVGESSAILVKGGQDLAILGFEYSRTVTEDGLSLTKRLMDVTEPQQAIELQSAYVTKAVETANGFAGDVAATSQAMMEAAMAPIVKQAEATMSLMSQGFSAK